MNEMAALADSRVGHGDAPLAPETTARTELARSHLAGGERR